MRQDLIQICEEHKDVTNAVILTHNIDFVFLQLVVLPALRKCGSPTLTIFADAQCATDTYAQQAPVIAGLGTRYRVVPVAMDPGFRFHPKALLLSGPTEATLLVGSGNLTFGGWRENAEVWTRFDTQKDGTAAFSAFLQYLQRLIGRIPLPDAVRDELEEAFDGSSKPWAQTMEEPGGLLGRVNGEPSLLDQIANTLGDGGCDRLTVCSPYFDDKAEALATISSRWGAATTETLLQQRWTGFPAGARDGLPPQIQLSPIGFRRKNPDGAERESFIHAKFYAAWQGDRVRVFAGSANCSRAALLIPGSGGNAELVAVSDFEEKAFGEEILGELARLEGPVKLSPQEDLVDDPVSSGLWLRILAARFDDGVLNIAYAGSSRFQPENCLVDDHPVEIDVLEERRVRLRCAPPRRGVVLQGRAAGEVVRSPAAWVDHEKHLRATARGRTLAGAIRRNVRTDVWNIGAWRDVMDVFCRHLQYMPLRAARPSTGGGSSGNEKEQQYEISDLFSDSYRPPRLDRKLVIEIGGNRVHSLQQMLLQWFGLDKPEPGEDDGTTQGETPAAPATAATPAQSTKKPPPPTPTDADRRAAKRTVAQMTQTMTDPTWLAERHPEDLSADLKIAATLLRTAFHEGWIESDEFLDSTYRIWSTLFFPDGGAAGTSWFEKRFDAETDPEGFIAAMASPELSATLATWALSMDHQLGVVERVRGTLACLVSVAHLPWLWRSGDDDAIGREMVRILTTTDPGEEPQEETWSILTERWGALLRKGTAFRRLERVVAHKTPAEIRQGIQQDEVKQGDILWQGGIKFGVATQTFRRSSGETVRVAMVGEESEPKKFKTHFAIPFRGLLADGLLPVTTNFGMAEREALQSLADDLKDPSPC